MNYEKRYKEILAKARTFYKKWDGVDAYNSSLAISELKEIFPELNESEDENIRQSLIDYLRERKSCESYGQYVLRYDHWITWLEKQVPCTYTFEIKEGHWYKCVCDYMLNNSDLLFKYGNLYYCRRNWRLEGEIDERNVKDIGVNGYKSFFRPATNQEIKDWLEKQGKHNSNILWHDMSEEPEDQCEIFCEWKSGDAVWHDVFFYHADNKTFWDGEPRLENVVKWAYVDEILGKQVEQKTITSIPDPFDTSDYSELIGKTITIPDGCSAHIKDNNVYINKQVKSELKPKFRVKYAGSEYNVLDIKEISGIIFYGIDDEPNHIDFIQAANCEII